MSALTRARYGVPVVQPIRAGTPEDGLPRADALTGTLLAGVGSSEAGNVGAAELAVVGEGLERGLSRVVESAGRRTRSVGDATATPPSRERLLRIGHYQVARALAGASLTRRTPRGRDAASTAGFRWTPRTARRAIGLAAVRAGLDGRAPTPSEAVGLVMNDPGGPFGIGRAGPGSCADWVTSLAPSARSLVGAEASAWATRLWTGLDWAKLDRKRLVVGGTDRWWRWSGVVHGERSEEQGPDAGACEIAVRGRADVRVEPGTGADQHGGVHLVVLDGHPGAATRHALLLGALVAGLTNRLLREPVAPRRVVGWWPDCGKAWVVPVDARTLTHAADAVVLTAGVMLGAETAAPSGAS